MLISSLLPGGGQLWAQAFGSAVLAWAGVLIIGGFAIGTTSAYSAAQDRAASFFASNEEKAEAAAVADSFLPWMLGSWVLLAIVWGANVYDARATALKFNLKLQAGDGPKEGSPAAPAGNSAAGSPAFCTSCGQPHLGTAFCGSCGARLS